MGDTICSAHSNGSVVVDGILTPVQTIKSERLEEGWNAAVRDAVVVARKKLEECNDVAT